MSSFPLSYAQVSDDFTVIGRSLFKKETNLQLFVGLKVTLSTGESGIIEGGFGQSGKFKIRIQGKDLLHMCCDSRKLLMQHVGKQTEVSLFISVHIQSTFSVVPWFLGFYRQFSGCGKSSRPDIPSHIPRIPLGIACVPGEVCSLFILPSVAPNPQLHTGRGEKTKYEEKGEGGRKEENLGKE